MSQTGRLTQVSSMQVAKKRYAEASKGQAEKLVSGSDDNTLYMWQPSTSKKSLARMTGHMQLVNQVSTMPQLTLACFMALQPSFAGGLFKACMCSV